MIKNLYWVLAIVCISHIAAAQECTLNFKGNVKDFHDGTSLVGATLLVEGSKKYAVTDINGDFVLKNLCKKTYWLIVSHISCDTKRVQIDLTKESFKVIRLEHHIEELNEITVTGEAAKRTQTAQESVLKDNILERYSSQSLADALQEIPGVSSLNTGNSIAKPVINGLHSSRVLIMTNNVRLQDQEWGIEHAPNVDISAAGSVSLIKGANALEFGGDAIGGIIFVNPRRVYSTDSIYGRTLINGHSNGLGYGINTSLTKGWNNGFYVSGQASYRRSGDYEAPLYNLSNTGNLSQSFTLSAGYKQLEYGFEVYYSYLKNEIGILRSSHIGNVEDLVDGINSQQPFVINDFTYDINAPKQDVTHQILKANFYRRFENFGKLEVQYDYQNNRRLEFDIRRGDDRDVASIDLELKTHTLKSTLTLDANANNTYKVGLMGAYQNNFPNPLTGVRRLIPDYDKYDLGWFAIGNFELNDELVLDAGVRYDFNRIDAKKFYITSRWIERGYDQDFADIVIDDLGTQLLTNPQFNFHNISASAGLAWQLNNRHSILFNYGLSNRAPNPSELFSDGLHHSAARIELGDLRIKKETSHRVSATYKYVRNRFNLNVDAFFNRILDFIYLEPDGVETTIRGAFPVWAHRQVNANLFGVDTHINYDISSNWNLQNKSSFIKGNDTSNDRALIDIPAFRTMNVLRFYKEEWSKLNVELQSEWVFRQNEFPDNNFDAFIPRTGAFVLVDVSTPPPAYHVMNLRGDMNLKFLNNNLNISLTVNNLFNTSYREYLNRLRYFSDELGRNFIIQLKFNY
jgi:iron complex outermembrane receptor protein